MSKRTINLLPLSRQKALEQEYWVHFVTVVLVALTWLVVTAGVLLIPSYVLLGTSTTVKQSDLQNIEHLLSSSDETELLGRLKKITDEAKSLRALKNVPSATHAVMTVLSVPHTGIALTGFVYVPGVGKTPRSVVVSGVASSRATLQAYQTALQSTQGISSAELPVSAYAKERAIPFTISVALLP
jgi:Tfp pilus assembly protein PilN